MTRNDIAIESFDLSPIIKQKAERKRVKDEIRNQFNKFFVNFKELQAMDADSYPKINFETCSSYHRNSENSENSDLKLPLKLQNIEL